MFNAPRRPKGFCLVCFAAVAAFHALETLRCGRVAMLDFDVHHGNGVSALVKHDERVRYRPEHPPILWHVCVYSVWRHIEWAGWQLCAGCSGQFLRLSLGDDASADLDGKPFAVFLEPRPDPFIPAPWTALVVRWTDSLLFDPPGWHLPRVWRGRG